MRNSASIGGKTFQRHFIIGLDRVEKKMFLKTPDEQFKIKKKCYHRVVCDLVR